MKKELINILVRAILIRMLIAFVLGFCMGFFMGCKTPQRVATENIGKEQKNIAKDITSSETSSIDEGVQRSIEKLKNGNYEVVISHTEYDTDKPVDTISGKPPVKSDTKTRISAREDIKETDNMVTDRKETLSSELSDKTIDKSKLQTEDKTKTERELSRIEVLSICLVAALFIVLVIYIIRKFKK